MALDDTPNRLESVWIQRDAANQYYEQLNVSGTNLIVYHSSSGELQADKITDFLSKYGGTGGTTVKVSENDTTPGFLSGSKLVPGTNISFSIINPGGDEKLEINSLGGGNSESSSWASSSLSSSYIYFNGNRPITRNDSVWQGVNVGTNTVVNFLEQFFFPFNPATVAITAPASTVYFETGSAYNITVTSRITANSETLFESGTVRRDALLWQTIAAPMAGATNYSYSETISSSHYYQTFVSCSNNGSPTLIYSTARYATAVYPYMWGLSTTPGLTGSALYSACTTKNNASGQSTMTPSYVGSNVYIYFCYPDNYSDLATFKDQNLFNYLTPPSSFEYSASVEVTSSGLARNWMRKYKVYRSKTQSSPNGTWTATHS